ncbi:MAG: hypothetical protein HY294_09975 [Candidatus Rokubacteria bacterium]|nr:hypothetical protein [Candidatus Rokubacteria bacterium]MBI3826312.1 hypothetical protein [Candidatus Rokubacteria bacterium]
MTTDKKDGLTLIDDGRAGEIRARVAGGRVLVAADALGAGGAAEVDLTEVAGRLGRPLALDVEERAAWLGVSAAARARALASLEAPDFALPDLAGRVHRLSEHRGKKVFLVAYASW